MQPVTSINDMIVPADFMHLGWLRIPRVGQATVRVLLGFLVAVVASLGAATAAHALSSHCNDINSDFAIAKTYVATEFFWPDYGILSNGEYVSWTYSTTGSPSTAAYVVVGNSDFTVRYFDRTNYDGNLNGSGNFTASSSANEFALQLGVDDGAPSDVMLTFIASCAAGPPPAVTSISPISGTTAGGTSVTISGTAFTGATGVTIGGNTPTGITVVSATEITATTPAHAAGATNVVVTTPNGTGTLTNGYLYVAIAFAPPAGALPSGTVGASYSQTIAASGGTAPYTYSVTPGSLPAGLSLNASTGVISGIPTAAGSYTPSITVTDANSATASASYTLAIATAPPARRRSVRRRRHPARQPLPSRLPSAMAGR